MKTRQGYVQGYNAQAVVSEEQIMAVGARPTMRMEPMLQTITLEAAGIEDRPKAGLADAGSGVRPISGLAPGQRCLSFLLPPPRRVRGTGWRGVLVEPVFGQVKQGAAMSRWQGLPQAMAQPKRLGWAKAPWN